MHRYKQTNDLLHQRLLGLEQTLNALIKKDSSSLSKETLDKLKEIQEEIQHLDRLLYSDIKNTKIAEPIQSIVKTQGTDINYRLQ